MLDSTVKMSTKATPVGAVISREGSYSWRTVNGKKVGRITMGRQVLRSKESMSISIKNENLVSNFYQNVNFIAVIDKVNKEITRVPDRARRLRLCNSVELQHNNKYLLHLRNVQKREHDIKRICELQPALVSQWLDVFVGKSIGNCHEISLLAAKLFIEQYPEYEIELLNLGKPGDHVFVRIGGNSENAVILDAYSCQVFFFRQHDRFLLNPHKSSIEVLHDSQYLRKAFCSEAATNSS